MSDDNVIHLPPKLRAVPDAPREKFGLRKPWLRADNLRDLSKASDIWELATTKPERKSLGALAELARAYGGDSNKVDPQLLTILAAQISGVSETLMHLSRISKSYGCLAVGINLVDVAGDCELIAARIEALTENHDAE